MWVGTIGVDISDAELLKWGKVEEVGVDSRVQLGFTRVDCFNLLLLLLLGGMLAQLGFD